MRISGKVILIIVISTTVITTIIFSVLMNQFERQFERNLLFTARAVYKNILIIRQWVSDYNGIYVLEEKPRLNPFLPNPSLLTRTGDTLSLKNPALVTRELSQLSNIMGTNFSFHMASHNYLNPINQPTEFEWSALNYFLETDAAKRSSEFYKIEQKDDRSYFRYFAPLFTSESCLNCHSRQGYQRGDLRGGISIILNIDDYEKSKRDNYIFFMNSAILTIIFLSILIFFALRKTVIRPLRDIESAARDIKAGILENPLRLNKKDEIGSLAQTFEKMRQRLLENTLQLKSSEYKYKNLIENSLEAVAIVRDNGEMIDWNSKLVHLFGYPENEIRGMNFRKMVDYKNRKPLEAALKSGVMGEHYETILFARDDIKIPVEIYENHGIVLAEQTNLSFIYIRDLSERKKIEQYSLQAEKMFALGQLSSGIAHEIRNPLFAINNNIAYLKKNATLRSSEEDIFPELTDAIEKIHKTVEGILDYSKPHQPEYKPCDINENIEKAIRLVQKQFEKSSIRIRAEFAENPKLVEADAHQIEQVFINLFLNAFQAMEDAGELSIKTRVRQKYFEIQISDNGKGIPEKDLPRIFDPFYTKSPNGTGLGLAIVQRILEDHKAKYRVTSDAFVATTFTIYLPYRQEASL